MLWHTVFALAVRNDAPTSGGRILKAGANRAPPACDGTCRYHTHAATPQGQRCVAVHSWCPRESKASKSKHYRACCGNTRLILHPGFQNPAPDTRRQCRSLLRARTLSRPAFGRRTRLGLLARGAGNLRAPFLLLLDFLLDSKQLQHPLLLLLVGIAEHVHEVRQPHPRSPRGHRLINSKCGLNAHQATTAQSPRARMVASSVLQQGRTTPAMYSHTSSSRRFTDVISVVFASPKPYIMDGTA